MNNKNNLRTLYHNYDKANPNRLKKTYYDVVMAVKEAVTEYFDDSNREKYILDERLEKQGIDSLDALEIIMTLEETFMIQIEDSFEYETRTPLQLIEIVCQKLNIDERPT